MKIPPKLMTECVKDFKKFGTLTIPLIMRRHQIGGDLANAIIEIIAKRYPNLWENRELNREKKWIEGLKP